MGLNRQQRHQASKAPELLSLLNLKFAEAIRALIQIGLICHPHYRSKVRP